MYTTTNPAPADDPYRASAYPPPQHQHQHQNYPPTYPPSYPPTYPPAGQNYAVAAPVAMAPVAVVPSGERLADRKGLRDPWWALLFIVHLLGVVAVGVIMANSENRCVQVVDPATGVTACVYPAQATTTSGNSTSSSTSSSSSSSTKSDNHEVGYVLRALLAVMAFSAVVSLVWLKCMLLWPKQMIYFSLGCVVAMLGLGLVFAFAVKNVGLGVVMLISLVLMLLYIYLVRSRIPFSAAVMGFASSIISQYPANIGFTLLGLFALIVYAIGWIVCVGLSSNKRGGDGAYLYLLFSFFWSTGVISNVVYVTVIGSVASYYFRTGAANPTAGAAKRATTTSFGSICLGSLIVAVVQFVRAVINSTLKARDANVFVRCIADCLLGIIESLVRIFNKFAFARVAIYGNPFIQSGREAWELLKSTGVDLIIGDDLSGTVVSVGGLVVGIASAIIGYAIGAAMREKLHVTTAAVVIIAVSAFIVGMIVAWVILNPVTSAVVGVLVCYADDPAQMSQVNPDFDTILTGVAHEKRTQAIANGAQA